MTEEINPDDYPHGLSWEDGRVYLVTRLKDGGEDRRSLGTTPAVRDAYVRWDHLRKDHGQEDANLFLWGVMTGMSIALWDEIERKVHADRP